MTQTLIVVPLRTTANYLAPDPEFGSVDLNDEDKDTLIERIWDQAEPLAFQHFTATPVKVKSDQHVVQSWALVRLIHCAAALRFIY